MKEIRGKGGIEWKLGRREAFGRREEVDFLDGMKERLKESHPRIARCNYYCTPGHDSPTCPNGC